MFRKSIIYNFTVHFLFHIFNVVLKKGRGGGLFNFAAPKRGGRGQQFGENMNRLQWYILDVSFTLTCVKGVVFVKHIALDSQVRINLFKGRVNMDDVLHRFSYVIAPAESSENAISSDYTFRQSFTPYKELTCPNPDEK